MHSFIFRFIISSHVHFLAHSRFLEDSWQERWCELSQLPQGPTLHRNGKSVLGLMGFPTYTRETVLSFKWMGSQIGKWKERCSCVAKGQSSRCLLDKVLLLAVSLRDEHVSSLGMYRSGRFGSEKMIEITTAHNRIDMEA